MNYANYVITGYALTAGVVAGYWLWVSTRLRRARNIPTDATTATAATATSPAPDATEPTATS